MLYTPASQFQFEYDDTTAGTANVLTAVTGVAATASGSTNTKGSWVEIVSATDREWNGFWLVFSVAALPTGLNAGALCDIGIGGAGSEVVVLPDFIMGNVGNIPAQNIITGFVSPTFVPLRIAKGQRVAVRTQNETASRVARCLIWAQAGGSLPVAIFSGCDTIGVTSSGASRGTNISSNASASTFGSWTNVGSTTGREYKGFVVSHQPQNTSTLNARGFILEFGYSSIALCRAVALQSTAETWTVPITAPAIVQNIPAGTQLQARVSCSTASNTETPSVAFHCFY